MVARHNIRRHSVTGRLDLSGGLRPSHSRHSLANSVVVESVNAHRVDAAALQYGKWTRTGPKPRSVLSSDAHSSKDRLLIVRVAYPVDLQRQHSDYMLYSKYRLSVYSQIGPSKTFLSQKLFREASTWLAHGTSFPPAPILRAFQQTCLDGWYVSRSEIRLERTCDHHLFVCSSLSSWHNEQPGASNMLFAHRQLYVLLIRIFFV